MAFVMMVLDLICEHRQLRVHAGERDVRPPGAPTPGWSTHGPGPTFEVQTQASAECDHSSWMSDSTPERGGKSRRSVKITRAGLDSLRESRKVLDSMWKGLDPKLRGAR